MSVKLAPDEEVIVDVTSSLTSLTYPVVELTLITGLFWMGIGFVDAPQPAVVIDTGMRNIIVGLWAIMVLWRFVVPVLSARRRRLILTDRRLILRAPGLSGYSESIPLGAVRHVGRRGKTILLSVQGYDRYVSIPDIPRSRRVADLIESSLRRPIYR